MLAYICTAYGGKRKNVYKIAVWNYQKEERVGGLDINGKEYENIYKASRMWN
jgi:hypothetical protein